jgi:phosphoglycerate dehydrogenase-like enzyme
MNSLNVLVVVPDFEKSLRDADKECLRLIRAVSPRIKVRDGAALAWAESKGDYSQKEKLDSLLAWADVLFGLTAPPNTIARAPRLKWIQVVSAGVDRWINTDIWRSRVVITGVSGIHATPIGEFVMAQMLMFAKNAPLSFRLKSRRDWKRYPVETLRGKSVGIVGLGHIGREIARLSKAFGMTVVATRRSIAAPGKAKNVDLLLPQTQMKKLLKTSDYVILSVPLTPETRHIIGQKELRIMKPTARLINIGRGALVDEEALPGALKTKLIAGAGLDVTEIEPLPKESPLWNFENVILSPHVSGGMENYMFRATAVFCENLRRYLDGKRLLNMIDREKGY